MKTSALASAASTSIPQSKHWASLKHRARIVSRLVLAAIPQSKHWASLKPGHGRLDGRRDAAIPQSKHWASLKRQEAASVDVDVDLFPSPSTGPH